MATFKVIITGSSGSGKTSILNQHVYGYFSPEMKTTIGVEFSHKDVDGETKVVFWDTAGQERFRSMIGAYYRDAQAVMFVFDVSSRESFHGLEQCWREYNVYGNAQTSVAIVVANKMDLSRVVSAEEARAWAVQKGLFYEEVSAKTGEGIEKAMDTLIRQMRELPEVRKETVQLKSAPKSDRCCY